MNNRIFSRFTFIVVLSIWQLKHNWLVFGRWENECVHPKLIFAKSCNFSFFNQRLIAQRKIMSFPLPCHWLNSSNQSRAFLFPQKENLVISVISVTLLVTQIKSDFSVVFKTLWLFKEIILPILQLWPELKASQKKSVKYATSSHYGQKIVINLVEYSMF